VSNFTNYANISNDIVTHQFDYKMVKSIINFDDTKSFIALRGATATIVLAAIRAASSSSQQQQQPASDRQGSWII
jgi:hypothetical protein